MTPTEVALSVYKLPFTLKPYQVETIDQLAPLPRSGMYLQPGLGKTSTATVTALFKMLNGEIKQAVVIMPPILIGQWGKWLRSISPAPSVTEYKGTPTERAAKDLSAQFVLMSTQIFKKDFNKLMAYYQHREVMLIVDEATVVGNLNDTHDAVNDFSVGRQICLLTGTPATKVLGAYGLCKFVAPGVYRNFNQFKNIHVDEYDFFGTPTKFKNLPILRENLNINARQILAADISEQLGRAIHIPFEYTLQPKHMKLYKTLAEEELLVLDDGRKIDATNVSALTHKLGQIVVNAEHFSGGALSRSATFDVIDEVLEEIGDEKLVIVANYRMTVEAIVKYLEKYKCKAIYGGLSDKQKEQAIEAFKQDSRVIVLHPKAAGLGVDGLQHVCSDMLFIEPVSLNEYWQTVARLDRTGQEKPVRVRVAIAQGTLQVRRFTDLLKNDETMSQVVRTLKDLKSMIFGQ